MKLHLNFTPKPIAHQISHNQPLMLVGSCFTEHIGARLSELKFKSFCNPNGILFNPLSIAENISNAINGTQISTDLIFQDSNLYYSFLNHSSINATTEKDLVSKLNHIQSETKLQLSTAKHLIITFGTAYAYMHNPSNHLVANCHKQSSANFTKKLVGIAEIIVAYKELIENLHAVNPELHICFTVSPVKHLKDGLVENNLSKATLLLACNALSQLPNCSYFPSFELVNDDLRDYRFYKEDMAHPNDQAINYVWEKFSEVFFNSETKEINKAIASINLENNHKLLFPESEHAKNFIQQLELKKKDLISKYPHIKL